MTTIVHKTSNKTRMSALFLIFNRFNMSFQLGHLGIKKKGNLIGKEVKLFADELSFIWKILRNPLKIY